MWVVISHALDHYIPQVLSLNTTNSFVNMLLPVQLSLPLFYEKTGLYLTSQLDQRKVWDNIQYLFLLFSTSVFNKLPLPSFKKVVNHTECSKGQ